MIRQQWIHPLCILPLAIALGCQSHPTQMHSQATVTSGSHKAHKHHHRNPEDIQQYLSRLDRPGRDEYQEPERVIEALDLSPTMTVADIGSGSGYFTRRFLKALSPHGLIYAVDVEPQMLDYVKKTIEKMGIYTNVKYVLAEPNNPDLPDNSVDLIFLCNVFHHLEDRTEYFTQAQQALTANGRVVIIDFYADERSGKLGFPRRHLVSKQTVIEEMTNAGFTLAKEHAFLSRQYFLEFVPSGGNGS